MLSYSGHFVFYAKNHGFLGPPLRFGRSPGPACGLAFIASALLGAPAAVALHYAWNAAKRWERSRPRGQPADLNLSTGSWKVSMKLKV